MGSRSSPLLLLAVKRYSIALSKRAISDGFLVVLIPQASMMSSLYFYVSATTEINAPACPMRLPAGAVTPAMKTTTGFFMFSLIQ